MSLPIHQNIKSKLEYFHSNHKIPNINKNEDTNNKNVKVNKDVKESKMENLLENFFNECKDSKGKEIFSNEDCDTFRKMLETKDEFFMSALEFYESNLDKEELIENLQQILK